MRYAFLVFPACLFTNVYDVLLVWQRESFFVDVGGLEPSSLGVIHGPAFPLEKGMVGPWSSGCPRGPAP